MLHAWQDRRVLTAVFALVAVIASLHQYLRPPRIQEGVLQTRYNNFVIFANAADHLAQGQNLYQAYPDEHWDLYKYSPSFALLMLPLARLPALLGLLLWNTGGALLLLWALRSLPLSSQATAAMAWIVLKDLLTNLQNAQSNAFVAALMILACACWERQRLVAAATAVALSFYLKIFGVAVIVLWVLYPQKGKFLLWSFLIWGALAAAPLLVTSPADLAAQYGHWWEQLRGEQASSLGISVMGILEVWFGIRGHNTLIALIGVVALLAPLARIGCYGSQTFRLGMLASLLMWVVLFNHRAESPTFVIATCGVAIWCGSRPLTRLNVALVAMTVFFSGFLGTDLVPEFVQNALEPYHVKAIPSLLVWIKLQGELWMEASEAEPHYAISIASAPA